MAKIKNTEYANIKAVILAGNLDFGRCSLASRLPMALWPVGERPALEHLLYDLRRQGIRDAAICANGDSTLLKQSLSVPGAMDVTFLDEPLPLGTAGCLRAAANGDTSRSYLILHANITSPPDLKTILDAHRVNRSSMTIMVSPKQEKGRFCQSLPEVYLCDASVLEYIPREGYFDIKEGLIPLLVKDYKIVRTAPLAKTTGIFRNRAEYIQNIGRYLENGLDCTTNSHSNHDKGLPNTGIDPNAVVEAGCRFYGPVRIMNGAKISEGAIILGPAVISRDVEIGRNTFLSNSILWDRCSVGNNCEIHNSIVDYDANVPSEGIIENKTVIQKHNAELTEIRNTHVPSDLIKSIWPALSNNTLIKRLEKISPSFRKPAERQKLILYKGLLISTLLGFFLWAYWPQISDLLKIWQRSDEYSAGFLVPFLAAYILWAKRHELMRIPIAICWWGLGLFVMAQAMRYFGLFFMYSSAERLSLVLTIASIVLFLFGWPIFRKVLPVLLFLLLMLPFPQSVHTAITLPLQSLATKTSIFFLELLGYTVSREGNIIRIADTYVAVAEACNGLRMVTSFFIIITMVALLIQRRWWEKAILIASGVPIALLCNSFRLTLTAIAFTLPTLKNWESFFHDFGGYAMMPVALLIVVMELWFLKKLMIEPQEVK